jgi:MarR family transcriptional regulator, organic hydroperoxide resistance regulator
MPPVPDPRRAPDRQLTATVAARIGRRALRSEFADAADSTGRLLWQVTNAWQAALRAALRPIGLTHVQFVLLASLTWLQSDDPVTQRRLAQFAGTDEMMTSQVLRTLAGRGLIERRTNPNDGRARMLVATSSGIALANRANAVVERIDREFFAALGAEQPQFTDLLARLAANTQARLQ